MDFYLGTAIFALIRLLSSKSWIFRSEMQSSEASVYCPAVYTAAHGLSLDAVALRLHHRIARRSRLHLLREGEPEGRCQGAHRPPWPALLHLPQRLSLQQWTRH